MALHYTNDDLNLVYMDPWGYIMFQMVYCIIAFPCLVNVLTITFEDLLPRWYIWLVLPLIVVFGVIMIYYFITVAAFDVSGPSRPVMGLYGVLYEFVCIWISYGVACMYKGMHTDKNIQGKLLKERVEVINKLYKEAAADKGRRSLIVSDSLPLLTNERPHNSPSKKVVPFENAYFLTPFEEPPPDVLGYIWPFTYHSAKRREKPIVRINYMKQWVRTTALSMLHAGMFAWCSTFTGIFLALPENLKVGYLFLFTFVTMYASILVRMVATFVDYGLSAGSCSLNIIAGLMTDTFFVVYQRNLFTGVDNWTEFIYFALVNAVIEVVVFQFCVTETYERWHDVVRNYAKDPEAKEEGSFKFDLCYLYASTHGWLDGNSFVHKNSLHLSYKCLLRLSSGVAFMIFETFIRYSYNKQYYDAQTFSAEGYSNLMGFTLVSMVLDFLIVIPTDWTLKKRGKPSLLQHFSAFFNSPNGHVYMGFFIWVIAHITTDVFVAKILYSSTTLGAPQSHHPTKQPNVLPTFQPSFQPSFRST